MKITMLLIKLVLLGGLLIVSNQNLHLGIQEERAEFLDLYQIWLSNLASQGVEVTTYVVGFEWLPPKDPTLLKDG